MDKLTFQKGHALPNANRPVIFNQNVDENSLTTMSFKKYVKNRRRFKIFLLLVVVFLLLFSLLILKTNINGDFTAGPYFNIPQKVYDFEQRQVVPEKYNEGEVKSRLIKDKIKLLTQNKIVGGVGGGEDEENRKPLATVTRHVHIFYNLPVAWYKRTKPKHSFRLDTNATEIIDKDHIPNVAFYPALGLYNQTESVLRKHFQNIRNCGIGVVILASGTKLTEQLFQRALLLAPEYNLTLTVELNAVQNKSSEHMRDQLTWVRKYVREPGFYKVFSAAKSSLVPLIYIKNAHKIHSDEKLFCSYQAESLRDTTMDGAFVGHIRLKDHTELMRRLCFDGFYSRLPSNGASYASTWKNWSYLKWFAQNYKMLFIPTVGAGYAERNKVPRHGNIQRHRSNGRYYGVAWRTAISNHIGFISVASYNNWPEGTQIEEAISHPGFSDYNPGKSTKYLSLTAHWVDNYLKKIPTVQNVCQKFTNNTIC